MTEGIPIEFLGKNALAETTLAEKLDRVLQEVKDGKIVIVEGSLSPLEKRRLIESSMENIDEDFPGIEFTSMDTGDIFDKALNKIYGIIGKQRRKGLTIVGNSEVMKKVKEDKESVSLIAQAAEQ